MASDIGNVRLKCTGTYYTEGNTRWSRVWTILSRPSKAMAAYIYGTPSLSVRGSSRMSTTATVELVSYIYEDYYENCTASFFYTGGNVICTEIKKS